MGAYNTLVENCLGMNIRNLFEETCRYIPGKLHPNQSRHFVLPSDVMIDFRDRIRRYPCACDSGWLALNLKQKGIQPCPVIIAYPLLGGEFEAFEPGRERNLPGTTLCLGAYRLGYGIMSIHGLGAPGDEQTTVERASKVLAHELAHMTGIVHECLDPECIMYNTGLPAYTEVPAERLGELDRITGWCEMHMRMLFAMGIRLHGREPSQI